MKAKYFLIPNGPLNFQHNNVKLRETRLLYDFQW